MNTRENELWSSNQNWIIVFNSLLDFYSRRLSDFGNRIIPSVVLMFGSLTALLANLPHTGSISWLLGLIGYLASGLAMYVLIRHLQDATKSKAIIAIVLTIVGSCSLGLSLPFTNLTSVTYQILSVVGFCVGIHFLITYWRISKRSNERFGEIIRICIKLSKGESLDVKWLLSSYKRILEDSAPLTAWLLDEKNKFVRTLFGK